MGLHVADDLDDGVLVMASPLPRLKRRRMAADCVLAVRGHVALL